MTIDKRYAWRMPLVHALSSRYGDGWIANQFEPDGSLRRKDAEWTWSLPDITAETIVGGDTLAAYIAAEINSATVGAVPGELPLAARRLQDYLHSSVTQLEQLISVLDGFIEPVEDDEPDAEQEADE